MVVWTNVVSIVTHMLGSDVRCGFCVCTDHNKGTSEFPVSFHESPWAPVSQQWINHYWGHARSQTYHGTCAICLQGMGVWTVEIQSMQQSVRCSKHTTWQRSKTGGNASIPASLTSACIGCPEGGTLKPWLKIWQHMPAWWCLAEFYSMCLPG